MKSGTLIVLLAVLVSAGCGHRTHPPLKLVGKWHKVEPGDTIDSVAGHYGANPDEVAELNDLSDDGQLASREEIFVPTTDGRLPGTGAPPPRPIKNKAATTTAAAGPPAATAKSRPATSGTNGRCNANCLAWPAPGKLKATFGTAKSEGIDIAAKKGAPVRAAADGAVIYAGDRIKGYGKMLLVRHDGDLITVYAHNSKLLVNEGAKVTRGQEIAKVGSTGAVSAAKLHFEVRLKQSPVDPLDYLPAR